jgi:hypothetical protein
LAALSAATAQTVWSGYDFSFTKADSVPPALPENQDRITENVWISRDDTGGIFNVHDEDFFGSESPAGTEWATYINNPTETIAAANYSSLTFAPWLEAYGGPGGMTLPGRLTGGDAVVHLIADDIYLDLRFTDWTPSAGGGGFSYLRSLPPSEPETTGDYNLDGIVDAADFVFWRKTFGDDVPEGTGADGVPDGTIDEADYDFWVEHFGEPIPPGAGSSSSAVPEPAGGTIITVLVLLALRSRRRQQA